MEISLGINLEEVFPLEVVHHREGQTMEEMEVLTQEAVVEAELLVEVQEAQES